MLLFGLQKVLRDSFRVCHIGLAVCCYGTSASMPTFPQRLDWRTELGVVIPGNASVVDKQLDAVGLLLLHLFCQLYAAILATHVAWQSVDAARTRVVELDSIVQHLLSSTCDVYLRTVGHKGLCDHQTNTSSAARYYGGEEGAVEEAGGLDLVIVRLSCS